MKALILAAGYGTRLYPITQHVAKALLLVSDKPIINYILEKLEKIDSLDEVFVVTNDKFFSDFLVWHKINKFPKPIKIINDETKDNKTRLGAIRDINYCLKKQAINDDLIVIGGDNLFDEGLQDFLSFARARGNYLSLGLYDVRNKSLASKYGVAEIDSKNRIIDFQEKPKEPSTALIAMCLYYFPKAKLGLIPEYVNSQKRADATGDFINWLYRKEEVFGFIFGGKWFDIGHSESYTSAQKSRIQ